MTTFLYKAFSSSGELARGTLEAASKTQAEEVLRSKGLTPFETIILASAEKGDGRLFGRKGKGMRASEIATFTRDFATLRDADVPLDQSLKILAMQGSASRRKLAADLLREVLDGAALSDALARRPTTFAPDYVNTVRAGETAGRLGRSLMEVADSLERRMEQKARLQSALVYPLLLIILALVSTGIVLGVLVPSIAPIFVDSGKPIPAGLRFIMDVEANLPSVAIATVVLAATLLLGRSWVRRNQSAQIAVARQTLAMPLIGSTMAKLEAARFARTLATQLRAGVPIVQGLKSASDVISNAFFRDELIRTIERVRNGETLSATLRDIPLMPDALGQMLHIGEESSRPDQMLERVAIMFERDTQRQIEKAMALVTPLLTIAIAGLVGGLIMTVMTAVLSINDLVTQ